MWNTVKLGDVATIIAGQSPTGENYNKEGLGMPFYQGKKDYGDKFLKPPTVWTKSVTKVAIEGDILMSVRAPVGALNMATEEICIGRGLAAIRVHAEIDKDYLFYALAQISDGLTGSSGAIFNSINKKQIESLEFLLPPLAEQQRIVAKLDAAFAEIDGAIEVAQHNGKNAEDLLERSIPKIITKNSSEIVTCTLGSAFSLSSGKLLSKKDMFNDGEINVYGGNGIAGKHNAYNLQGKNILIGRVGAKCGNVHYVDESLWLTDNAMYAHTFNYEFNLEFLSLLLSKLNLGKYARQAAQPVISFSSIKDIIISFPKDLREQKQIIKSVLDIENHTLSLTKLHEYRQDNYNALKSAILAQELQREAV